MFLTESVHATMRKASLTSLWAISLKSMQYLVQKKDRYEVEPLRAWLSFERNRLWLYVCNMPFHMGEASEQNRQHYFEEVNSVLQKCMSCRKVRGSLNFTKGCIASFHILHFFCKNTASYLKDYLVFKTIILKWCIFLENGHAENDHADLVGAEVSFIQG